MNWFIRVAGLVVLLGGCVTVPVEESTIRGRVVSLCRAQAECSQLSARTCEVTVMDILGDMSKDGVLSLMGAHQRCEHLTSCALVECFEREVEARDAAHLSNRLWCVQLT